MNSFSDRYLKSALFNSATTWFLSQCAEARGMQEMWKTVRPEVMEKLREYAIIQSTESSNRIEGVEVDKKRLVPLVLGKLKPMDRPEEEIVGYRRALDHINRNYKKIDINPASIQKLHALSQGGMISDAGKWKERSNDIIEILSNGERIVRFTPVAPTDVPKYMEQLCHAYNDTANSNKLPELIAVSNFILDFLCIHPFRDGNGRVSRLLTLLLLYQQGFEVGRYISLERIIEETKDSYYEALKKSSLNWFDAKHDLIIWWHYLLGTIKSAYQELKNKVELSSTGDNMSAIIRQTALAFGMPFSVADIIRINPTLDRELIKKVISSMKKEKIIKMVGKGRGAKWVKR